jgi:hypothetical protein
MNGLMHAHREAGECGASMAGQSPQGCEAPPPARHPAMGEFRLKLAEVVILQESGIGNGMHNAGFWMKSRLYLRHALCRRLN